MSNSSPSREWDATAYHRLSEPQVSWGKKVLSRLRLRGDETLLDAGCGTGRLTADLLQALPHGRVIAVDLSQKMLQTAREFLTPNFGERVSFIAADLQHLPFQQALDGIVSTAAFHWVLDHDRLFRSLYLALRPGGWLQAQCGGGSNLARLRKRVIALAATPKYAAFLANFAEPWTYSDAQTAAETLRRAGFIDVETNLEPAITVLRDADHFSEFLRTVILCRHLERIPDSGLKTQFVAELARQAASDDPPYSLDYWRLNLSGHAPSLAT
jgi:trans-aconitate methyltransferase